jgi:hypothetical protein
MQINGGTRRSARGKSRPLEQMPVGLNADASGRAKIDETKRNASAGMHDVMS